MERKIAVLGGGPMGLILTSLVTDNGRPTSLWMADRKQAESLNRSGSADLLGTNWTLPEEAQAVSGYGIFEEGDWIIACAVSSRVFEETIRKLLAHLPGEGSHTIAIFTKGLLGAGTRRKIPGVVTYSDFVEHVAHENSMSDLMAACVNGPSLLQEATLGEYVFFNIGCPDRDRAMELKEIFESETIRIKGSKDRLGVELSGVLKNPIAIACGMAEALPECGSNFQGELLSRGFREMMSLGVSLGARPATLLGRSGLADLITTGTSEHSRNRAYGKKFIEQLSSGENAPGIMERIQLFVRPEKVIEREVLRHRDLVEGAFALSAVLEIAREQKIKVPLYQVLFDILARKAPPADLIRVVTGARLENSENAAPAAGKQAGLQFMRGANFRGLLEDRVIRQIGREGIQHRITRQAPTIIASLEKRLERAKKTKNKREQKELPRELELWRTLQKAGDDQERGILVEIIRHYVSEIADNYRPGMRETLIRVLGPLRFMVGGIRPGAGIPFVGGRVREIRNLAARYNVLYAPTHRSHLDSVEVAFGLSWSRLPIPRYAAGINLMSGPVWGWLLKSMGAYAVDREKTRNILYLECLTRYSTFILESGIPSLVYPEGTRSRSGGIVPLKTGLLSTALDAYRDSGREVIIVPLALSYENVPEDAEFARGKAKLGFNDFILKRTRVYMDLGAPIRVSQFMKHTEPATAVGHAIAEGWRRSLRILPNQLVARVLCENDYRVPRDQLHGLIEDFIDRHDFNYLTRDAGRVLKRGVRLLKKRGFIKIDKKEVRGVEENLLRYYGCMVPSGDIA